MRYEKNTSSARVRLPTQSDKFVLGMLYVVEVRLVNRTTCEKHKHKLLVVGCEESDIERKMRWMFDKSTYKEMSITSVEKVREKVHFLSTVITQPEPAVGQVIERDERSQFVKQQQMSIEPYDPKLFVIGLATTMLAKDEQHALRKVGHALVSHATEGKSHSGASLSDDSTLTIEQISKSSGYAMPRDVSLESNKARMFRG